MIVNAYILFSILHRGLSLHGDHWIGLSDLASEGTWSWLSGNTANVDDGSFWEPSRPLTHGHYPDINDCATAFFSDGHRKNLFVVDWECSAAFFALCEKPV